MTSYVSIMGGVIDWQTGLDDETSEPRCIPPSCRTLTFYVKQVGGDAGVECQLQAADNPAAADEFWVDFGDAFTVDEDTQTIVNLPAPIGLNAVRLVAGASNGTIEFGIYGVK